MATISEFINKVGFKVKNEDVKSVNDTINGIKNTANKLLGAIGIGFSLASINGLVEEFTRVKQQIKNSTDGLGEQEVIQKKILAAATATRSTYATMTVSDTLYLLELSLKHRDREVLEIIGRFRLKDHVE